MAALLGFLDLTTVEVRKLLLDLISDTPENSHDLLVRSSGFGWIGKANMQALAYFPLEDRAILVGIVADCNHVIKGLIKKLPDVLGRAFGDVDSDFVHGAHGVGIDARRWRGSRRLNVQLRIE